MKINNRGSILILCFWALIFLTILGLSITRRVGAHISLVRYQVRKVQSKYAAFAGLFYVLDHIRRDLMNEESRATDTLYNCGLALENGETPRDIFAEKDLGETMFSVKRVLGDQEYFGLQDETGKLNINALTEINHGILRELLIELGVDKQEAEIISSYVIDWKDANNVVFQEGLGAEQDYYQHLSPPYDCKNQPFENIEELLLVRGMTPEIFDQLRPYVTVFPKTGTLKINFATAPEVILRALARSVVGPRTNTSESDAEDFVRKLIEFRNGSDGEWGTADDEPVLLGQVSSFNGPDIAIASALVSIQSPKALFIRTNIEGRDRQSGVKTFLNAVIQTDSLAVVSLDIQ